LHGDATEARKIARRDLEDFRRGRNGIGEHCAAAAGNRAQCSRIISTHEQAVDDPLAEAAGTNPTLLVEPVLRAIESGSIDPRRVVLIDGRPYLLDIRFRMLKNRELARAMGFDDDESHYEFIGTQSQVTKQIGNAVCVNLAAALVRAILDNPIVATTAAAA